MGRAGALPSERLEASLFPLLLHDLVAQPFSDSWCESKMRFTTCYLVGPE